MKTLDERRKSVAEHMKTIQTRRRRLVASVTGLCLVAVILAGVLFVPYDRSLPDMSRYAGSDYYQLIQRLNEITYRPPEYKNNFDYLTHRLSKKDIMEALPPTMAAPMPGAPVDSPEGGQQYQEVTDNQVSGVIEADLIKRSDRYAYYLRGFTLTAYSIAGEASELVGEYTVDPFPQDTQQADWESFSYLSSMQMYLSMDCNSLILVARGFSKEIKVCTVLMQLDVSDPRNIEMKEKVCFLGDYVSSRMVDGNILLTYHYRVNAADIDFDDPTTFVPSYGTPGNMNCISGEQIICPENAGSTNYTVLCKVDADTLDVNGSVALLSYSNNNIYVSEDTIYATFGYSRTTEVDANGIYANLTMTQITGISYAGEGLEILGTVALEGRLKNQYSMDQHNGILRVVTSTSQRDYQKTIFDEREIISSTNFAVKRNVNLYCVDLADWTVMASVIAFAPEGEDAQSVRFDGDHAYVCTAEVITFTDPVYFFDLSDLSNITWKDTGTIDGYSTSLVQLANGFLLGIGYSEQGRLKIEVYEETADGVKPVCAYEPDAFFSEEYKSYFIDRENSLIGLHISDMERRQIYCLLHFNGYQLVELKTIELWGSMSNTRAFLAEGWLYVFADDAFNNFACVPIF